MSLPGRLGLNLCAPAFRGPTAAAAAARRPARPPVSKGPMGAGGVAWSPAPGGFLRRAGWARTRPPPLLAEGRGGCNRASFRLPGQWRRPPLLSVPVTQPECEARLSGLLPTLESAPARTASPLPLTPDCARRRGRGTLQPPWMPKEDVGPSFRKRGGRGFGCQGDDVTM